MRRPRWMLLLAVLVTFGLVAGACGDDDDDATATDDTTTDDTAAGDDGEDGDGDGLELARARVAEFRQDVAELGIDESVPVPENLKIFYVQCAVPVCESIRGGIAAAADAIGADLQIQTTQDTPDTVQAAFQAAVQAQPDIVMTSGNPREWFEDELAALNDAGIPVVGWSIPEGYQPDGFAANLITGGDYYFNGVLMADYVTAETDGNANVLLLNIPQFPVLGLEQQGFEKEFAEVCPGCKLTAFEVTVPQLLAGEHIGIAISELQKDPEINFIVTGFGDMLIGMGEALSDAGLGADVRAISQAGTPLNYGFITSGVLQVADIGLPTEFLGWRAVDAGLRALAGQDVGSFPTRPLTDVEVDPAATGAEDILVAGLPYRILEADSIDDPAVAWPGIVGYQDLFLALWGVN